MINNSDNFHKFLSISLLAGPGVLRPRAETELLGRVCIGLLADFAAPRVVDMCCGSGNLGLAIAHERPDARVFLSDLTAETVGHARGNAKRLGLEERVAIGQGDMFSGVEPLLSGEKVDLVVCNPPYISTGKLAGEAAHLLVNEPREAFDGGAYGISIHQRLIADTPSVLRPGAGLPSNSALARTGRLPCCSGAMATMAKSSFPMMPWAIRVWPVLSSPPFRDATAR